MAIRIYALGVQFCTVRFLRRGREVEKLGRWEAATIPHEHWGFTILESPGAQFLRQGVVDGLHLTEGEEVKDWRI